MTLLGGLNLVRDFFGNISYSQCGEDLIIQTWMKQKTGFYVDIGCNDPIKINNTYLFYKKGWRGITIEPNPILFKKIKLIRPYDINLNIGLSNMNDVQDFFVFNPHSMSTFSIQEKKKYEKLYELQKTIKIPCKTLNKVLDENNVKNIDIMSIDVEGLDLFVLATNNWQIFRPKFLIVETVQHYPIVKRMKAYEKFAKKHSYHLFADTLINSIFISNEYLNELNISL